MSLSVHDNQIMCASLPVAIVGGGPAGAVCAESLARNGREVVLLDEKLAWEKPCGGGITYKAIESWPFFQDAQVERNWVRECQLIAPSGRRVCFSLDKPVAIFSRRVLNGLLLERARLAGVKLVRDRVIQISGAPGAWRLQTRTQAMQASYLVLAAGARNPFRCQFAHPFEADDLMITAGYYIPRRSQLMQVRFLPGLQGYVWVFPRADHLSAGICGKLQGQTTAQLLVLLDQTLAGFGLDAAGAQFYAHLLPSLRASTLQRSAVAGEGWAMIGDAAGLVDPVTGEGLYYAMRSAELLAQALLQEAPQSYAALLKGELLPELEMAARVAGRFYQGHWMGQPVLERMVQFTEHSSSFRQLMRDMFAGSQGYRDLRRRLYCTLPAMLAESLASALRLPPSEPQWQQDLSVR
jgi:flavin-dependent dehydrogenase